MSETLLAIVLVLMVLGLLGTYALAGWLHDREMSRVDDMLAVARAAEVTPAEMSALIAAENAAARQDFANDRLALHELDDRRLFVELTRSR